MVEQLSRSERLKYINEIISGEYGFPPFTDRELGKSPETPEILNLVGVEDLGESRIKARFRILDTDGDEKEVEKYLGGTIVMVLPIITQRVNGVVQPTIQMSARWRIEFRCWSMELPTGLEFDRKDTDFLEAFGSPAHRILARTFGPEFVDSLSAARVFQVHEFFIKNEFAPAKVMMFAAEINKDTEQKFGDGMRVGIKGSAVMDIIVKGETIIQNTPVRIRDINTAGAILHAARKFPRYFS